MGVVKSHRNRGIGMGMVLAGIRWLKEQGCGSIELRYVACLLYTSLASLFMYRAF